jgi:hypothetical protein
MLLLFEAIVQYLEVEMKRFKVRSIQCKEIVYQNSTLCSESGIDTALLAPSYRSLQVCYLSHFKALSIFSPETGKSGKVSTVRIHSNIPASFHYRSTCFCPLSPLFLLCVAATLRG